MKFAFMFAVLHPSATMATVVKGYMFLLYREKRKVTMK